VLTASATSFETLTRLVLPRIGRLQVGVCLWVLCAVCALSSCITSGAVDAADLPVAVAGETKLGVGDVVEVRVFGEPDLTGTHQVSPDGQIRLPLVGAVDVAGQTPDNLARRIETLYNAQYLKQAQVSLFVREQASRSVYVLGQVAKPGPVPLGARTMTVIEAIALAGGTTKTADPNRSLLTREADGKQLRVVIPVGEIGIGRAADVPMQAGDILFVPESPY
jgi:protein involved in polysaccharide export with SLBB domain